MTRYLYSVIRYVPCAVRAEFLNVGVLLMSSDGDVLGHIEVQQSEERVRAVCGDLGELNAFLSLVLRHPPQFCDYRSVIQLTQPLPILSPGEDEALHTLRETFL